MNTHNTPEYIVSTLENELKRLGVDENFVRDVSVFHCHSKEDGMCKPKFENGKMTGVIITIKEERSQLKTKGKVFHEAKHTKQYFKKGVKDVEDINPVYNELEAIFYGYKRLLEEGICYTRRKLKSIRSLISK